MSNEILVTVIGNLTADPELRFTQSGLPVANFTIASTPRVFDRESNSFKDGEAVFLRASIWRDYAEHVAASFTKGQPVIAQGVLKQRSYETKEGEKRTSIELEVTEIGATLRYGTSSYTKAESKGNGGQRQAPAQTQSAPAQSAPVAQAAPAQSAPAAARPAAVAPVDDDGDF